MFAKKGTHERPVLCHTTLHFMQESVKNDATDERLEMPIPRLTLTVSGDREIVSVRLWRSEMARLDEDGMLFKNSSVDPSEPKRPATQVRLWMIVTSLIVAGGVLTVVVAIGIQHHNDRLLSAQLIQSEVDLQTTGARIADIKDHKFKTMAEYVSAYVQIEPLLNNYGHKLQAYADLCNRAQRRDEKRSLIDILRRERP